MGNKDIAIIGLGVMGQALAMNFTRNGYHVVGYDRDEITVQKAFSQQFECDQFSVVRDLKVLVETLTSPRKIFLVVPAGQAVDEILFVLKPLLASDDVVVDCGNSHYSDTERRQKDLSCKAIDLIGLGVSGGERGALIGPSLMAGGCKQAYDKIEPILQKISAKAGKDNQPCAIYAGKHGAGHYVKMVHNGIEYAEMQLIAECYDFMKRGLSFSAAQIGEIFSEWNCGIEASFLIEISAEVLAAKDDDTGRAVVDIIVDQADQKGTGCWTSISALELGVGVPTISAGVEARIMSMRKKQRMAAAKLFDQKTKIAVSNEIAMIEQLRKTLFVGRIAAYAQGLQLLSVASRTFGYELKIETIVEVWQAGCILRSAILETLKSEIEIFQKPEELLLNPGIAHLFKANIPSMREIAQSAICTGIPVPAITSVLAYYDSFVSSCLPANLIQAQRDYFGSHGFNRIDKKGKFHGGWKADQ